ncbi:hypothetical protein VTN77DRAFT_7006 [Rasamsonia byssochlamydoides]|uniref:uncharacterized protein n=1 Tax=Rasamsonia byssochlamydoides TaxID=89139 RepID=UPI0037445983
MDSQWQSVGFSYVNQEDGFLYPPGTVNPHGESEEQYGQTAPRTACYYPPDHNPPAPSSPPRIPPIRDPWGFREIRDAQDPNSRSRHHHHHDLERLGDLTGQHPGTTFQYPPYQHQFQYPNQLQPGSPTSPNLSQHNYTLSASQSRYSYDDPLESGRADRHLLSQASYGTTARRQVRQDSYGHFVNHQSPITAEEADRLADEFDRHLSLPPDDTMRAERQSHHLDTPARGYESQMQPSPGRPNDSQGRETALERRYNPEHAEDRALLDPRYELQDEGYFEFGKVFAVLWHQNAGARGKHQSSDTLTSGKYGEKIYSSIRRMVVVKNFHGHSWCLAIFTYSRNGVAKRSLDPSNHAVIYNAGSEPYTSSREPPMSKDPLAVRIRSPDLKLDRMSRLNFGKIYTVEHNEKVLPIGKISKESLPKLKEYARDVMNNLE